MGLFKKLIDKINQKFYYVVDCDTLMSFLKNSEEFAVQFKLDLVEQLNLYYNNRKYEIMVCNLSVSEDETERYKGIVYYVDDTEIPDFKDWVSRQLGGLRGYFKIELVNGDSVELNNYMNNHPELDVNNYWG